MAELNEILSSGAVISSGLALPATAEPLITAALASAAADAAAATVPLTTLSVASASAAPATAASLPPVSTAQLTSSVAQAPVEDKGSYQRLTAKEANFEIRHPFSSGEVTFDPGLPIVYFPSGTGEATREAIQRAPNFSLENNEGLERYATVLREGLNQTPADGSLPELVGREAAMFVQGVEVAGQDLHGAAPKFKVREGVKYTGEAARNYVRDSLRLGTLFSVPLWHSGFWITVRAPGESAMIELHRQLTQEKTMLGRSTYGLLYSQGNSYTVKTITDFVMDHLHSSSLALPENESIVKHIQAPDYQLLLWAMACAHWNTGFQYTRGCISEVEKCQYVINEKVNLARLMFTDRNCLTERQKTHMANRQSGSTTLEQVKLYREQFLVGRPTKVKITEALSVTFKMPTLADYITAGMKWVGAIEEQYGRALGMGETERNDYLLNHAQAQTMRQFSHFVQSITVNDAEIDDVDAILGSLSDMSSQDDIRESFLEKVIAFQNSSIVSFIAIPNYKCPSCNRWQNPSAIEGVEQELIALDVAQAFFTLLMQKLATIRAR